MPLRKVKGGYKIGRGPTMRVSAKRAKNAYHAYLAREHSESPSEVKHSAGLRKSGKRRNKDTRRFW